MPNTPDRQAVIPAVRMPWWWNSFAPPVPVGSPQQGTPGRGGPVVVPAPGTAPEFGPDEPDPGLEPEPFDGDDVYADRSHVVLQTARSGLFAAVVLIILLFFFAVTLAPRW